MTENPAPSLGVVDALAQLSFLVQGTLSAAAADEELSLVQTRLLGVLRDRRPGMRELAAILDLDKSSVTGLVDRAERRGLVQRVPSREDRRMAHVELTPVGRAVVDRVVRRFTADVERLVHPLAEEDRAALTTLATRVLLAQAASSGIDLTPAPVPPAAPRP